MRQGCGRFKATANELPVSMDKNRLSVSVFHGYNSIGMKRAFQALPTVNSERPLLVYIIADLRHSCKFFGVLLLLNRRIIADDITPHSGRHYFGTNMHKNGVPTTMLSQVMGHADGTTTMDIYCHDSNEFDASDRKKIEEGLRVLGTDRRVFQA